MAKQAFAPRSGFEDLSGSVQLPNEETYDVGEALKHGGGQIVLDPDQKDAEKAAHDRQIAESLALFPGLKPASVESSSKGGAS